MIRPATAELLIGKYTIFWSIKRRKEEEKMNYHFLCKEFAILIINSIFTQRCTSLV